jgi:hypothetical protein
MTKLRLISKYKLSITLENLEAGHAGSCLQSQIPRRGRSEGWWFEVNLQKIIE